MFDIFLLLLQPDFFKFAIMKDLCLKLLGNIKSHIPFIYIITGLFAFGMSLYWNEDNFPILNKISSTVANIFLVSVFLSFLIDSAKYLNIFQDALTDVIYDNKFLSKRKDIQRLWENVSKAMFKQKFPQINHDLLVEVKKNYLPNEDVSFYQDYTYSIDLKFDENEKNLIHQKNDIRFILHTQSKDKFTFQTTNRIKTSGTQRKYECKSFKVNNTLVTPRKSEPRLENGYQITELYVDLEGDTKYNIDHCLEKTYLITEDNFICFQAKWLVRNIRIQLFLPDNVSHILVPNGLDPNSFKCVKNNGGYCEYEYKGLLLRHQGFIIILNPKNLDYE